MKRKIEIELKDGANAKRFVRDLKLLLPDWFTDNVESINISIKNEEQEKK